jgi:hypothetical protein
LSFHDSFVHAFVGTSDHICMYLLDFWLSIYKSGISNQV